MPMRLVFPWEDADGQVIRLVAEFPKEATIDEICRPFAFNPAIVIRLRSVVEAVMTPPGIRPPNVDLEAVELSEVALTATERHAALVAQIRATCDDWDADQFLAIAQRHQRGIVGAGCRGCLCREWPCRTFVVLERGFREEDPAGT